MLNLDEQDFLALIEEQEDNETWVRMRLMENFLTLLEEKKCVSEAYEAIVRVLKRIIKAYPGIARPAKKTEGGLTHYGTFTLEVRTMVGLLVEGLFEENLLNANDYGEKVELLQGHLKDLLISKIEQEVYYQ